MTAPLLQSHTEGLPESVTDILPARNEKRQFSDQLLSCPLKMQFRYTHNTKKKHINLQFCHNCVRIQTAELKSSEVHTG